MINVLFVCHGNICRSPMAAYILDRLVTENQYEDYMLIDSCGVSNEEEGNPMDERALLTLMAHGIKVEPHEARQFSMADYDFADDILCMDEGNKRVLLRMTKGDPQNKIKCLMDYTRDPRDVEDPWYTGDFERAYNDILEGCIAYLRWFTLRDGNPLEKHENKD